MPFASDLHPEFGYVGNGPSVFRRLRLVLSFVVLGIVGGASGIAVFMPSPDSADPLDAMALAPAEALIEPKIALPIVQPASRLANASGAEKADKPLIASAPIGHRDDPTLVPALPSDPAEHRSWSAAPREQPSAIPAPTEMAIAEVTPPQTPAAELGPPAPAVTSTKTQPRAHHELRSSRRSNYS